LEELYRKYGALLEGHFLLSSGKHSQFYLQSAKILEYPEIGEKLGQELAKKIEEAGVEVDLVCSPALGGILAGYELARGLGVRFIFTERKEGKMTLRRGFEIKPGERVVICEDIITTGGSALEAGREVEKRGGKVVAFTAIANRGLCPRTGTNLPRSPQCKLPENVPFFALGDFQFKVYDPAECPLCKAGSTPIKPGSRPTR
jgi:orotate phosphoribosyltransferase